jgi:SAM-dependent methyltransferase
LGGTLALILAVALSCVTTTGPWPIGGGGREHYWSPYYRIDYTAKGDESLITTNLIGHQILLSQQKAGPVYASPHLLWRDAGGEPFRRILIIGAGSGNDLSRAVQFAPPDAEIDAVEIDPVIQSIGARDHPDKPYADPRVRVHLDDGRNFLRRTTQRYDLVIFALVDSLVLHSGYSNLRLESYLFTVEAFQDVRRVLKPDGLFVMYNHFRQGWLMARLLATLKAAGFDDPPPLLMPLPWRASVASEESFAGVTLFIAGNTEPLRTAFAANPYYVLSSVEPVGPQTDSGFRRNDEGLPLDWPQSYHRFGPITTLDEAAATERTATDDWPFFYLRSPMLPELTLRGTALLAAVALGLGLWLVPRGSTAPTRQRSLLARMFFLGAGFMLIETKAVVQMALLFGSTWIVNTAVFAGVLLMILLANLFVAVVRPQRLGIYVIGLFLALIVSGLVPYDALLGWPRVWQVAGACGLAFTPIAFAGVIFAVSFARSQDPDRAFGANVAGALVGGLTENLSLLLGFRHLAWVATGIYLAAVCLGGADQSDPKGEGSLEVPVSRS